MYLSLLQVAEVGANLVKILRKLMEYLTHEREFIGKLKRAITYPMIVVLFAFMVVLLMLFWVIPTFEQVFAKIKVELPLFTQIIIKISQVVRSFYFWVFAVGGGYCAHVFYKKYAATKSGRRHIDRIRLKIPVFGKIIYSGAIARFVQALSLLLGGGLPIAQGLEAAKGSILNSKLIDAVDWASKRIREGSPLGVSLGETQVFPTFLIEMINVGEESGSLVDMLDKVAAHFEEDFDFRLNKFLTILEPVLIILVGGMVIFILLTIYLPIFKLWGGLGTVGG
jgi:type IV pilus assembly protein PilC